MLISSRARTFKEDTVDGGGEGEVVRRAESRLAGYPPTHLHAYACVVLHVCLAESRLAVYPPARLG